jgi:hypothetical protein
MFANSNHYIKNKKNFTEEENKIKFEEIKQNTDELKIIEKELYVMCENYNTPDYYATNIDKPPPTQIYLTENAAMFSSVTSSTILECNIKDVYGGTISSGKTKFKHILVDIFKTMDPTTIINNSKFKFKLTNEYGRYDYIWDPYLKLSIKGKCANKTFDEIRHLVKFNKYTIQISIKLKTGDIIHLNKLSPDPY